MWRHRQLSKYRVMERLVLLAAIVAGALGYAAAIPQPPAFLLTLAFLALAHVLALMRAARQANRIAAEIGDLGRSIDAIARGQFTTTAPTGAETPEVAPLQEAVNALSIQVRETVEGLHQVALRDPLTGLPNRKHFQQLVERQLQSLANTNGNGGGEADRHAAAADQIIGALLFIDIDGFKVVNDTLGHSVGDQILQMTSDRLKLATRVGDGIGRPDGPDARGAYLSRLGGDEFTVFLANIGSEAVARRVAARVLRVLAEPFELGARTISVGASIGIAMCPRDGGGYDELLRAADTAMYHAKQQGRGRVACYSPSLDETALRQANIEQELRRALAEGQFELHFQPLFNCRTLEVTSAEALLRWHHPRHGLMMPGEFIPMAEKMNLINDIGEWVLVEATQRIASWAAAGMRLRVSVNVSPSQLRQMEFIALVKASLARWNTPPELLELEITEAVAKQDIELAADRLTRIRALGVSVAMDDFGTGYSNLSSLTRLPISRLKLDRSLLDNLASQPEARTLVQTMIGMARGLGFESVAEGVEQQEQLDLLAVMGCTTVQGFLLSRPLDEPTLRALMAGDREKIEVNHIFAKLA